MILTKPTADWRAGQRLPAAGLASFLRCVVCAAALVSVSAVQPAQAQRPKPSEYQVKATYLYNFGKFVHWPGQVEKVNAGSFEICVLGQDPFGAALDGVLAGETINGKAAVARRISKPEEAATCGVLFISSSEREHIKKILAALQKAPILTVSDMKEFSEMGGMVQFVMEDNRVRFEVNVGAAERAGLSLSSELLKVALNVRRN
ncbi:MAG: YfiR family protein [Acidobacteriales bacterium]|nr:YfiR family protein [Terriglobales bacterium]